MRICFLADSESIHTKRWCNYFAEKGHDIHLISFKQKCPINQVTFHSIYAGEIQVKGGNWRVLLKIGKLRQLVKKIAPDVLHAHYATSYGLVGAFAGFSPYVVTALGSDVLISPRQSLVYKWLLKLVFFKADWITTMADHMKVAAKKYIGDFDNKTQVLPFGIDTSLFNDDNRTYATNRLVIVSTRNFEDVYRIPDVLHAVNAVRKQVDSVELHLVGDGSKREEVEELVRALNLSGVTKIHGRIPQPKIVDILKKSHVFLSLSSSDGNNISLNEAMACGCLPIASKIPANEQWISHGKNGFLTEVGNVDEIVEYILESHRKFSDLIREALPLNRKIISDKADWHKNMKGMEDKYLALVNKNE